MLNEMKKLYTDQADFIPNWKDMSKTELCNLYIQNEDNEFLKNCYFSAIILNYWNKIYHLQSNTYLTASLEDAYQWIVDSILYALKHRKWLDPNNKLYNDSDAPDKVINRRIKCTRINYLIHENRDKRKIHVNLLSLNSFEDADNFIGNYEYRHNFVQEAIEDYWNTGKFKKAIILDLLAFGDCQIEDSCSDLVGLILDIDDTYINYFSDRYKINKSKLEAIINDLQNKYQTSDLWGFGGGYVKKSESEVYSIIYKIFNELKTDENLRQILC